MDEFYTLGLHAWHFLVVSLLTVVFILVLYICHLLSLVIPAEKSYCPIQRNSIVCISNSLLGVILCSKKGNYSNSILLQFGWKYVTNLNMCFNQNFLKRFCERRYGFCVKLWELYIHSHQAQVLVITCSIRWHVLWLMSSNILIRLCLRSHVKW